MENTYLKEKNVRGTWWNYLFQRSKTTLRHAGTASVIVSDQILVSPTRILISAHSLHRVYVDLHAARRTWPG